MLKSGPIGGKLFRIPKEEWVNDDEAQMIKKQNDDITDYCEKVKVISELNESLEHEIEHMISYE